MLQEGKVSKTFASLMKDIYYKHDQLFLELVAVLDLHGILYGYCLGALHCKLASHGTSAPWHQSLRSRAALSCCAWHSLHVHCTRACHPSGWVQTNKDLRAIVWQCITGTSNTKHALEDMFREVVSDQRKSCYTGSRYQRFQQCVDATAKNKDTLGVNLVALEDTMGCSGAPKLIAFAE
jgi:hypothetical protein